MRYEGDLQCTCWLPLTRGRRGARHNGHPEVIGVRTDDPESLLEGDFDLETQAIEFDDLQGGEGEIGGHQEDRAAIGMAHGDEADEYADRAPQQVGGSETEDYPLFVIDGTRRFLEEQVGIFQQCRDLGLHPVLSGPALGPWFPGIRGCRREERYAGGLDPRDEMVSLVEQPPNDLASCIVGIGHEVVSSTHG